MTVPQVSVVIPTRDRAQLLPRAVASVLAQSFQDFELIIVDDASADGSEQLARGFRDARVRYLRHPSRRGGAAARNSGIARARGEYVAFLDDDDEWLPEKLERQIALMRKSSPVVAACYTGRLVVAKDSGAIRGQLSAHRSGRLYPAILAENLIGGTSSVLARRGCLQRVGGFDGTLPSFQDYDLWIRLAREFEFESIADALVRYTVHEHQVWGDLDALARGLEMMLMKYGEHPKFRHKSSIYFQSFGVRYCERNQGARARYAFRRAAELQPWRWKNYVYWGASFLGRNGFHAIRRAKAELMGRLKGAGELPKVHA
jgi:glycosyltransferase involved in cell wall biosynthesis